MCLKWDVLVIVRSSQDDSHLNRKIVRRILESAKTSLPQCEIVEADDGSSAIQEMKKKMDSGGSFDFVLIDFVMVFLLYIFCEVRMTITLWITDNYLKLR